ncbi:MAG: hypothetical protein NC408_08485 [Candidatus Gastranaerophilales bacterium]|nr:hypothetical protein [Candidatus Gastranaerophilales bacterium]MCM1072367.1 hypothetical protein [Bacteroides sp.]
MDLTVIDNQIVEAPALSPSGAAQPSAPNSIHTVGGSNAVENNNTSFSAPEQTQQSALDKAFQEVLGEAYPKIKEDILRIISKLGIHAPKNKVELTDEKINEIKESLKKLVESLKSKKLEITAENLFNEACNVIDTSILKQNGITREEYEAAVQNGEAKSLREVLGLKEGEEISEAKVAAYAKKVVTEAQARVKKSSNPVEALKAEIAAQKKQFALCLVSTPIEDRSKLFGAIEHAFAENRAEFINEIFSSLTPEARIKFANQIGWDKIHKILSTPDINNNTCTIDEQTGIITTVAKHQSEETIRANEEKFMVQAREFFGREDVKAVQVKIKNGKELTAAEQQIAKEIETYTAYSAGTQIGVTNSVVLTEESVNELLVLLQNDSYELPNYREVLEQIHSFIENEDNAEYLTVSKEEVTKLLDKASNGNYSTVASDIKNGTTTELNAPKDPNATSAADLGYVSGGSVDYSKVNELRTQIFAQSPAENNQFEIVIDKPAAETTSDKTKTWTKSDIAKNPLGFFRAGIKNMSESDLIYAFNKIPTTIQTLALEVSGGKVFNLFLKEASDSAVLGTTQGRTLCQSKQLEEARQEIEERMA